MVNTPLWALRSERKSIKTRKGFLGELHSKRGDPFLPLRVSIVQQCSPRHFSRCITGKSYPLVAEPTGSRSNYLSPQQVLLHCGFSASTSRLPELLLQTLKLNNTWSYGVKQRYHWQKPVFSVCKCVFARRLLLLFREE